MEKFKKPTKIVTGIMGVVVGALVVLGIRFVNYESPKDVHYHANFAVYIDGQQEQFANPLLYEEISECEVNSVMKPGERSHLHENVKDVVHVEDEAVTWGNFFQIIGWNVGNDYIDTSKDLLVRNDSKRVSYVLNGEVVGDVSNEVIGDKDRLLVSYGDSTKDQLNQQFATVASTAEKYNVAKDPASCSGEHDEGSLRDRMSHLF